VGPAAPAGGGAITSLAALFLPRSKSTQSLKTNASHQDGDENPNFALGLLRKKHEEDFRREINEQKEQNQKHGLIRKHIKSKQENPVDSCLRTEKETQENPSHL
jgi:hypothetical protein